MAGLLGQFDSQRSRDLFDRLRVPLGFLLMQLQQLLEILRLRRFRNQDQSLGKHFFRAMHIRQLADEQFIERSIAFGCIRFHIRNWFWPNQSSRAVWRDRKKTYPVRAALQVGYRPPPNWGIWECGDMSPDSKGRIMGQLNADYGASMQQHGAIELLSRCGGVGYSEVPDSEICV